MILRVAPGKNSSECYQELCDACGILVTGYMVIHYGIKQLYDGSKHFVWVRMRLWICTT